MVLIKKRRKCAIVKALEYLRSINSLTNNLTENDLEDESALDSVKKALCEFVTIIKENKLEFLLKDINGADCLFDCCIDGFDEEKSFPLLCMQTYTPIIISALSERFNDIEVI